MENAPQGWQHLSETVFLYNYVVGSGLDVNAFAFRFADGTLGVMSPPSRCDAAVLDALADFGDVSALIAPNSFHHAGLSSWQARFSDARIYAGDAGLAALRKKRPKLSFHPVSELSAGMGEGGAILELPAMKNGEVWLRVRAGDDVVYYAGDVLFNASRLPGGVPGLLMRILGMNKGFCVNPLNRYLMMKDRSVVRAVLQETLAAHPVTVLVPGHGGVLDGSEVSAQVQEQVARV